MFRIIWDEEEAQLLCEAGLLWWVSQKDGADVDAMFTDPMRGFTYAPITLVRKGVVGIKLED